MPKFYVRFEHLFKMLRRLNRVCDDDCHYYIVLDMRYFHLFLNGKCIYRTSDVGKFYDKMFRIFCDLCYPYMPLLNI